MSVAVGGNEEKDGCRWIGRDRPAAATELREGGEEKRREEKRRREKKSDCRRRSAVTVESKLLKDLQLLTDLAGRNEGLLAIRTILQLPTPEKVPSSYDTAGRSMAEAFY